MVRLAAVLGPLTLALWVFCVIDVILTRDEDTRHLGKYFWLALVLFFPLVGSLAWLAVGRPRRDRPRPHERAVPEFPEYNRPGRAAGQSVESDEEFLKRCRERAEEQRRRHRSENPTPEQPEQPEQPDQADEPTEG